MKKKIVLITGATAGIGLETARQLLQEGQFVIIGARNLEKGQEKLNLLKEYSSDVDLVQLDTTSEASVSEAASYIESKYGYLDVLVNNAGLAKEPRAVSELNLDDWQKTFDTNLFGTLRLTTAMIPLLRKAKEFGNIVNVSSGLGSLNNMTDNSHPYSKFAMAAYSASKAALNVYTIQLARDLEKDNIKVNAVCPGYTKSESNLAADAQPVEVGAKTPVTYAMLDKTGPTGGFFSQFGLQAW